MKPTQDQINKWLHEVGVAGHGDLLMISQETLRRFTELACAWKAEQGVCHSIQERNNAVVALYDKPSTPKNIFEQKQFTEDQRGKSIQISASENQP